MTGKIDEINIAFERLFVTKTRIINRKEKQIRIDYASQAAAIDRRPPNLPIFTLLCKKEAELDANIALLKPKKLSKAQLEEADCLIKSNTSDVLVEVCNISISGKTLYLLRDGAWLSDEILNSFGGLAVEHAVGQGHFFSSFFYTNLCNIGYRAVQRWTKRFDLFSLDLAVFPVHLGNHWCCGAINFPKKRIEYYDSLKGSASGYFTVIRMYLASEHIDKKKTKLDLAQWSDYYPKKYIPSQRNGYDCGVFVCAFIENLFRNRPLTFSQSDMRMWRRKIALELCNKTLLT